MALVQFVPASDPRRVDDLDLNFSVLAPVTLLSGGSTSHSDGTNTITGSARWFFGNGTPSADDSAILIGRALTGSYNLGAHAVRDESTYSATGTGFIGYASFDSITTLSGSLHWNHFHAFQARQQFTGSGLVDESAGYTHQITHNGTGTITNSYGLRVSDALGTGPITQQVGIWIDALTRGTGNFSIFSGSTALPGYHGGRLQLGNKLLIDSPATAGTALQVTGNAGNFAASFIGQSTFPCQIGFTDGQTGTRNYALGVGAFAVGWLSWRDNVAGKNRWTLDTNGSQTILTPDGGIALTVNGVSGQNAIVTAGPIQTTGVTVATLPAAATVGAGSRHFVTDANAATFNSVVAGGGTNKVPVFSDGTSWRIG